MRRLLSNRTEWAQLFYKIQMRLQGIDLSLVGTEDLGLSAEHSNHYCDGGGPRLETVLRALRIGPEDAILDLGCGKGGALLTFARFPFARIDGLDISSKLLDVARRNLGRFNNVNFSLICMDACRFQDYDPYSMVYMFNPFPAGVTSSVLNNIVISARRAPRKLVLIYVNPTCHVNVIKAGFKQIREFHHGPLPISIYELSAMVNQ